MATDMSLAVISVPRVTAPIAALAQPEDPFIASARENGWLIVQPGSPGPAVRGRLALFVEGAIERALDSAGAPPPGVAASCNMAAALEDQLCRAKRVQARGVAVSLDTLGGIADLNGALDSEDSAAVRWWLRASSEHPVRMRFASVDAALRVFDEPKTLQCLLEASKTGQLEDAPAPLVAPEVAASVAAMELSERPPPTTSANADELPGKARATTVAHVPSVSGISQSARAMAAELEDSDSEWLSETLICLSTPPPPAVEELGAVVLDEEEPSGVACTGDDRSFWRIGKEPATAGTPIEFTSFEALDLTPPSLEALSQPPAEPEDEAHTAEAALSQPPAEPEDEAHTAEAAANESTDTTETIDNEAARRPCSPLERDVTNVTVSSANEEQAVLDDDQAAQLTNVGGDQSDPASEAAEAEAAAWAERCEAWRHDLQSAHGPKPLAVVERQFVSAFVHLRDALDRGYGSAEDRVALDEWAQSFEKSYSDAFIALRARGKRPTMVLDIPDIALRMARLHGARTTQLLLVDGMRFDLGMRIHERLKELNTSVAACAERLLLWSALPTTSSAQIELIGRGPAGLRDYTGEIDEEMLVARGRKADTIRRLRTGQRELLKLDLAEARLSEPGGPAPERLDEVGVEIAERLASHFEGVPERTLVMIFGDHGFKLAQRDGGTAAATQGGASPEEVLVPAFAWVVGAVH